MIVVLPAFYVKGKIVPVLRNGVDELYVMDYEAFREMKVYIKELSTCI